MFYSNIIDMDSKNLFILSYLHETYYHQDARLDVRFQIHRIQRCFPDSAKSITLASKTANHYKVVIITPSPSRKIFKTPYIIFYYCIFANIKHLTEIVPLQKWEHTDFNPPHYIVTFTM